MSELLNIYIEPNPRSISYSTLSDAKYCGEFYRLKNIEKLYVSTNTIWTHYGTLVHKYMQAVLMGEMEPKAAAKKFIRTWFRFCKFWEKQLHQNLLDKEYKLPPGVKRNSDLYVNPARAIMTIQKTLEDKFGSYKVLWVEYRLEEETDFPQEFTGYIDIGFELEDGKIIIADFKTCGSYYMFNKYRDKYTDYQLTLYKHFYSKRNNIDPKKIETYFITISKSPKDKASFEFIRVTSGPIKIKNALTWLDNTLQKIQNNSFQKNRMACRKFFGKSCPFFETIHCT